MRNRKELIQLALQHPTLRPDLYLPKEQVCSGRSGQVLSLAVAIVPEVFGDTPNWIASLSVWKNGQIGPTTDYTETEMHNALVTLEGLLKGLGIKSEKDGDQVIERQVVRKMEVGISLHRPFKHQEMVDLILDVRYGKSKPLVTKQPIGTAQEVLSGTLQHPEFLCTNPFGTLIHPNLPTVVPVDCGACEACKASDAFLQDHPWSGQLLTL